MSKPIHSYSTPLTPAQVENLRANLEARDCEFVGKPYSIYSAKLGKLSITVYEKGPKVFIQGKETEAFIQNTLEPDILGQSVPGIEGSDEAEQEMFSPHFGIDESGKGDFFGPLVVAGVFTDEESARFLRDEGVMDSKRITSDSRIRKLSDVIRSAPGISYETISLDPPRYGELYDHFGNVNRLLAWGHASVIENLLNQRPDCPRSLSDQFAEPRVLLHALQPRGRTIQIEQRTKAESDIAVAAASILAREAFINWVDGKSEEIKITIPRGATGIVKEVGRKIVTLHGTEMLELLCKVHFQTYEEVIRNL